MKLSKWVLGAGLVIASTAAFAATTPGAGITGTKHDWSSPVVSATSGGQSLLQWLDGTTVTTYNTGTPNIDPVTGKQTTTRVQFGLCTKCHTPHQAKSTNLLWNHTLSTNTFTWDVPSTTAGTAYPAFRGDTYKGPTTKCLSCHDGSLASTDGVWFNRQTVSGSKYVSTGLNSGHEVSSTTGNMSGSHPVAMPYPYNGASNIYNGTFNGAATIYSEFVGDPQASGIRLFNDLANNGTITAGAVAGKTGIECTSCHDVHNGRQATGAMLLRGNLTGGKADGYICTKCHDK